jgi:hypothetical protein
VLVTLRSDGDSAVRLALMGELVRRAGSFIELREFNPEASGRADAGIEAIHKVVGELI